MAKRRQKKRTHVRPDSADAQAKASTSRVPKSFVMRSSKVTPACTALIHNMRKVMEPNTAIKLTEQRSNKLKDYLMVAGQLGVSHFMVFSQTDAGTLLRISRVPKGPTLAFRVKTYSLIKDVSAMQVHARSPGKEYQRPPLLVLNNFNNRPEPHVKLMASVLQNLFPALNVQRMHITDCRRVVMFDYDADTDTVDFRHYYINVKQIGVSKSVKRIVNTSSVPNMAEFEDISDFILRGAHASESDIEDGATISGPNAADNVVTLGQTYVGRGNKVDEAQRAIRLSEIGPRMTLSLLKIQQGFCAGDEVYLKTSLETSASTEVNQE